MYSPKLGMHTMAHSTSKSDIDLNWGCALCYTVLQRVRSIYSYISISIMFNNGTIN